MSASTIISDVTETLQGLLESKQPHQPNPGFSPPCPTEQTCFTVSVQSPAEQEIVPGSLPIVNLFLFRVMENPFAKNQEWIPIGNDALGYPPLALNLFYVLTPFGSTPLDEQRALGEAMRIFYNNSIIRASDLKGTLAGSAEELKLDLCQLSIEDLTRIWNALNKPYRLSVCYEVRIALIDSLFEESTTRVMEKQNQFV